MDDLNLEQFKLKWQKTEVIEVPHNVASQPLVSVCIQTFNQVDYIKECIDSVIYQKTNFPIEILLAEDESEDGTRSICLDYARRFPEKIKLFLHSRQNNIKICGEPSANFAGLYNFLISRGKYIAVCEGDDKWNDIYKLQKQVDFLRNNPTFVLSYHPYITIDHYSKKIHSPEQENQPKKDLSEEDLLKVQYHPLLLTLCFKNVFNRVPAEMLEIMNLDTFILSVLGNYGKGKFMDKIQPSSYRKHGKGVWAGKLREKKLIYKIQTFERLEFYYSRTNRFIISQYFKIEKKMAFRMLVYKLLKSGEIIKIWRIIKDHFTYYQRP